MINDNVAGGGICSCMIGRMGNFFGGISGCFGAVVGAPRALDGEITPPICG